MEPLADGVCVRIKTTLHVQDGASVPERFPADEPRMSPSNPAECHLICFSGTMQIRGK